MTVKVILAAAVALAALLHVPVLSGDDEVRRLQRPELKATTVQPYHFATGIDITTPIFDDLAHLDSRMMRVEFIHDAHRGGVINYPAYDYIFDQFAERGIEILGLIDYQSVPYDTAEDWNTPEFREDFVERTREIVEHYANRENPVTYWEIWNEPDLDDPNSWYYVEVNAYAELLAESYHAIKEIDPYAFVIMGGLSPKGFAHEDRPNYLEQLYETDTMQEHYEEHGYYPFDAVAVHPYPETYFNPYEGLAELMNERVKAVMNRFGDRHKKVWVTELGWNSAHNDEETQRLGLIRSFNVLDELRDPEFPEDPPYVERYFWFKYDSWHPTEEWGLVSIQRTRRKPAYYAFLGLTEPGPEPPPPVEPGEGAPVRFTLAENDPRGMVRHLGELPHRVSRTDLLQGMVPEIVEGEIKAGELENLTNGRFDFLNPEAPGPLIPEDGPGKPLHLRYTFPEEVDIREIRIFAGDRDNLGARAFQSHEIRLDGVTIVEDLRTGNYMQDIRDSRDAAISMVRWEPDEETLEAARGVRTMDLIIWPVTSYNGDFRDRWCPATDPDKDVDGGGPAYLAPVLYEIDVFGSTPDGG